MYTGYSYALIDFSVDKSWQTWCTSIFRPFLLWRFFLYSARLQLCVSCRYFPRLNANITLFCYRVDSRYALMYVRVYYNMLMLCYSNTLGSQYVINMKPSIFPFSSTIASPSVPRKVPPQVWICYRWDSFVWICFNIAALGPFCTFM